MKYLIILTFTIFSIDNFASDTFEQKINNFKKDSLGKENVDVHTAILKIKKEAEIKFKYLNDGNEYNPDDLYYSVTIDNMLTDYPENFEQVQSCEEIQQSYVSMYNTSWDNLPTPILNVWPMIEKICKK